ncbi:DUF3253 domain-containing protein [Microbacterium foliorum]|uniref:DUF3253 domain-containing protein n=1 Tax=Microbacterium foliorum TaxID=104336 RepID=UPI001DFBAE13|nr:DUF3253 domain-containing protein [Microbacterium foliorum]CAH0185166.1 hypothetical protein SRABI03_01595 [Microbacterium foliorum]CAH0222892.1 hypothetical protein SRABI44_02462 [Microbacterium foliorum]
MASDRGARSTKAGDTDDGGPELTPDGHHVIIGGRRWRATDPSIPESFRQELVDELMAARRAVRGAESDARRRVQDAKTALGERGAPWWEEPAGEEFDERIAATIRALTRKRDGSSICPSDVARAIGGDSWRALMPEVRRVASILADSDEIVVTQKGETVDIREVRGPVRMIRGPRI